jgi:hypothetical protein
MVEEGASVSETGPMDHSPSVLRSDDAPLADPDESPRSGEVSQGVADGTEGDADIATHLDGQPRDDAASDGGALRDAEPASRTPAAPLAAPDADTRPDAETAAEAEDPTDLTVGPYPDDSLWPADGVRAIRANGLGAELTPRSAVDPYSLLARDPSAGYPVAASPVDPRTLGVPERARPPRPMAL